MAQQSMVACGHTPELRDLSVFPLHALLAGVVLKSPETGAAVAYDTLAALGEPGQE